MAKEQEACPGITRLSGSVEVVTQISSSMGLPEG